MVVLRFTAQQQYHFPLKSCLSSEVGESLVKSSDRSGKVKLKDFATLGKSRNLRYPGQFLKFGKGMTVKLRMTKLCA